MLDRRRTKTAKPDGVLFRTGGDPVERAQQAPDDEADTGPAAGAALGHARVQQCERDPASDAARNQVRPQLALDQHREIRSPMVEEAVDPAWKVERREAEPDPLVRAVPTQPLRRQALGVDGAGGQQQLQGGIGLAQRVQQRQQGQGLADAGGVHPDQPAFRTWRRVDAAALGKAPWQFLAPVEASAQQQAQRRLGHQPGSGPHDEGPAKASAHAPAPASQATWSRAWAMMGRASRH